MENNSIEGAKSAEGHHSRCNHFVQRFYNKAKSLSPTTKEVIDELQLIKARTAGVVEQRPDYGDFDVLSALLSIISELGMTIDWKSLNKSYYWHDFSAESKIITALVPNLKKKVSAIFEKAKKLCLQSDEVFPYIEPLRDEPFNNTTQTEILQTIQARHSPPVGITISWNNFTHEIETKYQNPDGSFSGEVIKCSTDRTRIRILRYLMNYTRVLVDSSNVTLAKVDAILGTRIPIDELQKCSVVKEKKLTPYEYTLLMEAKTQLDKTLLEIHNLAAILKYHFKAHLEFVDVLKKIKIKNKNKIEHAKTFIKLDLCVDDALLINFWLRKVQNLDGNDAEEDPLPVILQDRSDDTVEIIGNMMNFSSGCFQKIEAVVFLLKKCEWNVFDESNPTNKDNPRVRIALNGIKENLKSLIRYLTKSIKSIKSDKILQQFFPDALQMKEFREVRERNPNSLWNIKDLKNENSFMWIHLTDEHRISFIEETVTLKNSLEESVTFLDLPLAEKVSVVIKLLDNLDKFIGYSRYVIEYGFDRVKYSIALTKRLTTVDQTNNVLETYVNKNVSELNLLLELANEIQLLQKIIV